MIDLDDELYKKKSCIVIRKINEKEIIRNTKNIVSDIDKIIKELNSIYYGQNSSIYPNVRWW